MTVFKGQYHSLAPEYIIVIPYKCLIAEEHVDYMKYTPNEQTNKQKIKMRLPDTPGHMVEL